MVYVSLCMYVTCGFCMCYDFSISTQVQLELEVQHAVHRQPCEYLKWQISLSATVCAVCQNYL